MIIDQSDPTTHLDSTLQEQKVKHTKELSLLFDAFLILSSVLFFLEERRFKFNMLTVLSVALAKLVMRFAVRTEAKPLHEKIYFAC